MNECQQKRTRQIFFLFIGKNIKGKKKKKIWRTGKDMKTKLFHFPNETIEPCESKFIEIVSYGIRFNACHLRWSFSPISFTLIAEGNPMWKIDPYQFHHIPTGKRNDSYRNPMKIYKLHRELMNVMDVSLRMCFEHQKISKETWEDAERLQIGNKKKRETRFIFLYFLYYIFQSQYTFLIDFWLECKIFPSF